MSPLEEDKKTEALEKLITLEEIYEKTERALTLPPSGDQTHVLMTQGADPWVISHNNNFYYCSVDPISKRKIYISKFSDLKEMATAELIEVWPGKHKDLPRYDEIWAPELQFIDGKWYVYFALHTRVDRSERMFVIEGTTDNPQGDYEFKGKIEVKTDRWAIDGSVLITENNEKYFIWSGWQDKGIKIWCQNIYIAKMSNPWTVTSDRVCISTPEYDWEKHGYPYINEGPQALVRNGKVFIIYSASGSWTDDYCLGQLTYLGGDMLDPKSWRKESKPVFSKTDTIFAPGHASFVQHNGEDWIIYHAARSSNAGWARQVRAKKFTWNEDGSPNFGKPI